MDASLEARLQYWVSQFWTFLRQNDRAIDCLRAALDKAPQMREAWQYLGFLYGQRGDHAEAVRALAEAVRLAPDDAETRFNLGFLLHKRGDEDGAIAQFSEVVRLRPSIDRAWYGLGAIHHGRREWHKAIPYLQEAAKLQYFNPHAGHLLATAYHLSGQQEKAVEDATACASRSSSRSATCRRRSGTTWRARTLSCVTSSCTRCTRPDAPVRAAAGRRASWPCGAGASSPAPCRCI